MQWKASQAKSGFHKKNRQLLQEPAVLSSNSFQYGGKLFYFALFHTIYSVQNIRFHPFRIPGSQLFLVDQPAASTGKDPVISQNSRQVFIMDPSGNNEAHFPKRRSHRFQHRKSPHRGKRKDFHCIKSHAVRAVQLRRRHTPRVKRDLPLLAEPDNFRVQSGSQKKLCPGIDCAPRLLNRQNGPRSCEDLLPAESDTQLHAPDVKFRPPH